MYDIIIIGGGPAGLTSSIYAARGGKKVLVLEANVCGGQIINTLCIDNYPGLPHVSGADYANILVKQAKELGAEIVYEKAIDINPYKDHKEVITDKNRYECNIVIIATGASNRRLGLEREEELIGKGVSYCATCDGNFFKKKNVAIIGGGNTALDDCIYLSSIASHVYLINRSENFRGANSTLNKIKKLDNVDIFMNYNVTKLIGKEKLEQIEITNKDTNEVNTLDISGLFIAIGQIPENNNLVVDIELDERGYIVAGEDMKTSVPGIYVAGDVRTKEVRQLTTAEGDGTIAATNALKELN